MTNIATKLARKEIVDLIAYSSARSLDSNGEVYLDANENPYSVNSGDSINRYPEHRHQLRKEFPKVSFGNYFSVQVI